MNMTLRDYFESTLPDVALIGKTRSGKDTVFTELQKMRFNVHRLAFGDYMKEEFFRLFPEIPRVPKPIAEQQKFNVVTEINPRIWVDKLDQDMLRLRKLENNDLDTFSSEIAYLQGLHLSFVITDVRQPHEYDYVREKGMVVVKVEAPEDARIKRMIIAGETVNKSILNANTEKHIDNYAYDYVIENNGNMEDLQKEVAELVFQLHKIKGNV